MSPDVRNPWPDGWAFPAGTPPVTGSRAMVASTDVYASRVGLDVLEAGGNAVDAAVAVSFALAVVNPEAGNVAGSGFLVLRRPDGDTRALDYRGVAPARVGRDMFLDDDGQLGDRSVLGPAAAAVPGTVAGLWEAHRHFGSRPWAELVDPSVELARGFEVRPRFIRSFEPHIIAGLRRFPASTAVFLPGGVPPAVGSTFRQLDLAESLARIRDHGPDGFYRGVTADRIVGAMRRFGGVITADDLRAYRPVWRDPVRVPYHGHTLVSMPPPSSGGVTLALMAQMLEPVDLSRLSWHGAEHVHRLVEAWRHAFADRNHYLADPDHVPDLSAETLRSREYARWRAAQVDPGRARRSEDVEPGVGRFRGGSGATTHVSIVGPGGDAVSLTTTLNTWYGSKFVVEGTGILLNNDMDDFTTRPGTPNHFGLVQGEANAIAPGKRMLSAMTPTLVLGPDGALACVVGSPGGATILTTVFQVVSNMIDHGMSLADAVSAPRVHHQHLPDIVHYEPHGLRPTVVEALEAMGHHTVERPQHSGDVQAVRITEGGLEGVADPRRGGTALGA